MAECQYWIPVIFRPTGSTAMKIGMIMSWKSLNGLNNTSWNHCLWPQFTLPAIYKCSWIVQTGSNLGIPSRNAAIFSGPKLMNGGQLGNSTVVRKIENHTHLVWVLDLPACSPDISTTENIWHIMTHKIWPRSVKQMESYIRQEWDNMSLSEVQQLVLGITESPMMPRLSWCPWLPDI